MSGPTVMSSELISCSRKNLRKAIPGSFRVDLYYRDFNLCKVVIAVDKGKNIIFTSYEKRDMRAFRNPQAKLWLRKLSIAVLLPWRTRLLEVKVDYPQSSRCLEPEGTIAFSVLVSAENILRCQVPIYIISSCTYYATPLCGVFFVQSTGVSES
jgi:hypothetical protein